MARPLALAAALAVSLLAVSGAGGADAQMPKRGGTVIVRGGFEPACLNPLRSCGDFPLAYIEEVLEGAFEVGPDRVRPNLVSRVEYTKTPPYTLTYHIRSNARWSDGVSISAKDFVFTYEAFRKYLPPDNVYRTYIGSVRRVDAKTVRVVLRSRYAGWKYFFDVVLPRHALQGEDLTTVWTDRIDKPKTGAPIASGPFLFQRWERGRQMTLVRNPRYWGPHPAYLDRLVLRLGGPASSPDEAVDAFRKGELDIYAAGLMPEVERDFRQIPGVRHVYASGSIWEHFEIRIGPGGHPALRKKLVRRALAYSINRVAIVRAIFGEFVPKIRPSDSAVLLNRSPYYQPNWSRYRFRPAEARRLLAQAGCRPGADGINLCAGEPLSLRFVTTAGGFNRRRALELAQSQLRRVGIEVEPSYAPATVLFDQILPSGDWDVALFAQVNFPPDGLVGLVDIYGCQGSQNLTGYCQRLVTSDLDQADRILDAAQRASVLNRADSRMAKDVPVIPIWNTPIAATVRSTIRGFEPSFPVSLAWNAENWWLDR